MTLSADYLTRLRERRAAGLDGGDRLVVALGARPRLRLADERAQLVEQLARVAALARERLDPVERPHDGTSLVHAVQARRRRAAGLCRFRDFRATAGGAVRESTRRASRAARRGCRAGARGRVPAGARRP